MPKWTEEESDGDSDPATPVVGLQKMKKMGSDLYTSDITGANFIRNEDTQFK